MLALSFVHVGGGKSFALDVTVLPTAGRSPRVGLCDSLSVPPAGWRLARALGVFLDGLRWPLRRTLPGARCLVLTFCKLGRDALAPREPSVSLPLTLSCLSFPLPRALHGLCPDAAFTWVLCMCC